MTQPCTQSQKPLLSQSFLSHSLPREFKDYLVGPRVPETAREHLREALEWICTNHPELDTRIAWNQPMFTHHGTFIVGFSAASKHLCFTGEQVVQEKLRSTFTERGYRCTKKLVNLPIDKPLPFDLLEESIQLQMTLKKNVTAYWMPKEIITANLEN
ncbi:iron chaperone [Alloscardovia venturai]|uniref:Iron chaperone n=1 Tax=Alloscardovia venturai TaxID=1769421 RepID=A0ABW2Y404_9BIFI